MVPPLLVSCAVACTARRWYGMSTAKVCGHSVSAKRLRLMNDRQVLALARHFAALLVVAGRRAAARLPLAIFRVQPAALHLRRRLVVVVFQLFRDRDRNRA